MWQPFRTASQRFAGQYEILHQIEGAGMSRLCHAIEVGLGRHVALKLLPRTPGDVTAATRFEREIMITAALQCPNIIPILTAGVVDGQRYYTMPWVAEGSLRKRLTGPKPVSPLEATSILQGVGRALACAESKNVLHRDLKPENILLPSGEPQVCDFGIAHLIEAGGRTGMERLTPYGRAVGTPEYVSPEQARGDRTADHRADIYSLGLVSYEMYTGQHAFAGKRSVAEILTAQLMETPRLPSIVNPTLPKLVDEIVMKALEKDRVRRYPSASALIEDLNRLSDMLRAPRHEISVNGKDRPQITYPPLAVFPFAVGGGDLSLGPLAVAVSRVLSDALARTHGFGVTRLDLNGEPLRLNSTARITASLVITGEVRRVKERVKVTLALRRAVDNVVLKSWEVTAIDDTASTQNTLANTSIEIVRSVLEQELPDVSALTGDLPSTVHTTYDQAG